MYSTYVHCQLQIRLWSARIFLTTPTYDKSHAQFQFADGYVRDVHFARQSSALVHSSRSGGFRGGFQVVWVAQLILTTLLSTLEGNLRY